MPKIKDSQRLAAARHLAEAGVERAQRSLAWRIWERMLEAEFVDRSIALAGKAFVSFFPLIIVVAAFAPPGVRSSILTSLTHRLGIAGSAQHQVRQAFASTDDIRRATGILGLVATFFYASSFTTALQRVFLRAWRRPAGKAGYTYLRGPIWLITVLIYMSVLGALRGVVGGNGITLVPFAIVAVAAAAGMWVFTGWLMLMGQVRLRVLIAPGAITGVLMGVYALTAPIWMPNIVISNQNQFGIFGIALALVTWLSGAAVCILIGACAGPVLVEDSGPVGRFLRFGATSLLVEGAIPSLGAPTRAMRLADAFTPADEGLAPTDDL